MLQKDFKGKVMYELSEDECRKLLQTAQEARQNTYPHPGQGYSVAVLTKQGNVYVGISYGSDTQTLTMHSEMTALAHAALHGEPDVVAITGPSCHICKQLIYENSLRSGIEIVSIIEEGGQIKQIPISDLMPYPWPDKPTF